MISHEQIDQNIAGFEKNSSLLEKTFDIIEANNNDLIDILIGSHGELLTEEEMDYLIFLFGVIYHVVSKEYNVKTYSPEEIEKVEEEVWQFINESHNFDQTLDHFYETIKEQEILDFIEVSIGEIEDSEIKITETGRTIMLAVLIAEAKLLTES
jgi:hypothetical protein